MRKYNNNELYAISMKLNNSTIKRIENIQNILNQDNKAEIISTAIHLFNQLLNATKDGGKVYIEKEYGTKHIIRFKSL